MKHPACLIVRIEHPNSCNEPRVNVEVAERSGNRGDDRAEYPSTPDEVNGLLCEHGELGLYTWIIDGRLSNHDGPEYQRVAYVNAYKCERMGKTLATLRRRLDKMSEVRGSALSWSDYVLRFAEAVGAKSIAFPKDVVERIDTHNGRERARDMYGERWHFREPREAAYLLRDLEKSFSIPPIEKVEPAETEAVESVN